MGGPKLQAKGAGAVEAAVMHMFGVSAFQRGDVKAALSFMSRACAHPEAPAIWHRNHAEILDRCGHSEAAEAAARLSLLKDPGSAAAWETLGTILVQCDKLAKSCACYEKAVQIDPTFVHALNNLAVTLDRLGRHKAAVARYRQVLRLEPDNAEIQLNFVTLLGALGQHQEGLEILQDVLDRCPDSVRANSLTKQFKRELKRHARPGKSRGTSAQCVLSTAP